MKRNKQLVQISAKIFSDQFDSLVAEADKRGVSLSLVLRERLDKLSK